MSLILRDDQTDLLARTRATILQGTRRVLIQAPTGFGKTVLVAQMLANAVARGKRAWFCVHRKELLDQSVTTFMESADLTVGLVAAGYPHNYAAPVQVCSVPSLGKRSSGLPFPDLVVWDECHHLASRSWATLAASLSSALQIGLTATPQRLDGQGLAPFFDALVQGPTTADLIARGRLSRYQLYAPQVIDLSKIHRIAGDYNKKEIADTLDGSTVVGDAVSHYLAHCPGARALVFAWNLQASEAIAASFIAAGVPAQHIDGETPRQARTLAMRQFRAGDLRVLCNVDLFGEGLDVPAVDAIFQLRPTQSLGLHLQQVGRGLRPYPGKTSVKIFDHVNNWQRHGLPDDPRVWSLDGRASRARESDIPMGRRCAVCFGISRPSAIVCALCGVPFEVQPREVAQVAGTLAAVDVDVLRALALDGSLKRPKTIDEWKALAAAKGYKQSWAYVRFQKSAGGFAARAKKF